MFEQTPRHQNNYEKSETPFSHGDQIEMHKSKLVSPEQGRAMAAAIRAAEQVENAAPHAEKHEAGFDFGQVSTVGRYVLAIRRAELTQSDFEEAA